MQVRVEQLVRDYGSIRALDHVSFEVAKGEIVGLLGPNGAGKSTTLQILMGALAPTSGTVHVAGVDVVKHPRLAQRKLGYLPERAAWSVELTVDAFLDNMGQLRGLGPAERARAVDRVVDQCGLTERRDQRIGTLSKGLQQRVGIAQALLHRPEVLVLDEPTSGLDPNQVVALRELIRGLAHEHTVVWSTHVLSEVEAVCERVVLLHRGAVVADAPTASLLGGRGTCLRVGFGAARVVLEVATIVEGLGQLAGVERVAVVQEAPLVLELAHDRDIREAVFAWAVAHGQVLVELSSQRGRLEDVFRALTIRETA